jgi:hypothetical protein
MADYITSANFKTRHGITTTTNDARIAAHVTAASREVDSRTGRDFSPGTPATVRYYHPTSTGSVRIDDFATITAIALDLDDTGTYATSLTVATDIAVSPLNGIGPNGQSGWPVEEIQIVVNGYWFRKFRRPSIKVTGTPGWAAIPTDVIEATYLIAHRLYYEVAVPSGITAPNVEFGLPGSPLQRPYTVDRLLAPYVRYERNVGIAG